MFGYWPEGAQRRRTMIPADPPIAVQVDLSRGVIQAPDDRMQGHVPLWLHKAGLDLTGKADGVLLGQVRSRGGSWLAIVQLTLHTGDQRGALVVTHLCPARWVFPRPGP
ncbi:MAG: hypothetical protein HOQ24_02355 [Mycobacteriaceae bacterium]|nr:hypothetical protein [Mycobacteriaceae bacterium]